MEEDFCRVLLVGTAVKSAYITQHGNGKPVKSVTNYLSVFFAQRILFLHFVLFFGFPALFRAGKQHEIPQKFVFRFI